MGILEKYMSLLSDKDKQYLELIEKKSSYSYSYIKGFNDASEYLKWVCLLKGNKMTIANINNPTKEMLYYAADNFPITVRRWKEWHGVAPTKEDWIKYIYMWSKDNTILSKVPFEYVSNEMILDLFNNVYQKALHKIDVRFHTKELYDLAYKNSKTNAMNMYIEEYMSDEMKRFNLAAKYAAINPRWNSTITV